MKIKRLRIKRVIFWVVVIILAIPLLPVLAVIGFNLFGLVFLLTVGETCVRLPNGMLISREALFDRKHRHWYSFHAVLKKPDGEIIHNYRYFTNHVTETTIYSSYSAYRPDVGLVQEDENPELHARLVKEAGPLIYINGGPFAKEGQNQNGHLALTSIYNILRKHPDYQHKGCPVALFAKE